MIYARSAAHFGYGFVRGAVEFYAAVIPILARDVRGVIRQRNNSR